MDAYTACLAYARSTEPYAPQSPHKHLNLSGFHIICVCVCRFPASVTICPSHKHGHVALAVPLLPHSANYSASYFPACIWQPSQTISVRGARSEMPECEPTRLSARLSQRDVYFCVKLTNASASKAVIKKELRPLMCNSFARAVCNVSAPSSVMKLRKSQNTANMYYEPNLHRKKMFALKTTTMTSLQYGAALNVKKKYTNKIKKSFTPLCQKCV